MTPDHSSSSAIGGCPPPDPTRDHSGSPAIVAPEGAPDPTRALTADLVARVLLAACQHLGLPREALVDSSVRTERGGCGGYKARVLAGATIRARLGVAPSVIGTMLEVCRPDLSPSGLVRRAIGTDDLLAVSEAVWSGGAAPASGREAHQRLG